MTTMRAKPPLPSAIAARSGSPPIESGADLRVCDAGPGTIAASSPPARIEVRWCCTAAACAALFDLPAEQFAIHDVAELIVSLTMEGDDRGQLEVHLVLGEHRRSIMAPKTVALITHEHDECRHLDALLDDRTILQLSWCENELRYAQTSLLTDAGLPGGSYDRPWLAIVNPEAESRGMSTVRPTACCASRPLFGST